jgi:hypothetical protein
MPAAVERSNVDSTDEPSDEIEPFVAYRVVGDKMEFALWPLADGAAALALFASAEAARDHLDRAHLGQQWRIVRPTKPDLLRVLEECFEAGTLRAVLDTGQPDRQIVFELFDVLQAARKGDG